MPGGGLHRPVDSRSRYHETPETSSDACEDACVNDPVVRLGPEMRAEIGKMLKLWDTQKRGMVRLRDGLEPGAGFMIHALTNHVVRLTRAVLLETEAGLDVEIMPQVRLSIECAMTAAWLLVTDNAGSALMYEGARQRRVALEAMVKQGHSGEPGLSQARMILDQLEGWQSGQGRNVEQRFEALADGETVYVAYRIASATSHAGVGLGDFYAEPSDVGTLGLGLRLDAPLEDVDTWVGIQGVMLLRTMIAMNEADVRWKRGTQLRRFARRLGVTYGIEPVAHP